MPWWLGWTFVGFLVVLWANRRRRKREDSNGYLLSAAWTEPAGLPVAPSIPAPASTVEEVVLEPPTSEQTVANQVASALAPDEAVSAIGEAQPIEEETAAPDAVDDLTRIEGIGPKIAWVLKGAGITSFAQLAARNVDGVRDIVRAAGLNLADPTTWPEQAGLAAAGDWEELRRLQESLKGGRIR
jgi:predicted flap endonuclease-1-like 5' DNA nuclease